MKPKKLTPAEAFVREVRTKRAAMGITQYELAEELGMSSTWLSQLLRYPESMRVDTVVGLVRELNLDIASVLRLCGYRDADIQKFKIKEE